MTGAGSASESEGRALLAAARFALRRAFDLPAEPLPEEGWWREPGACFVTLKLGGRLRGCIGTVNAFRPLLEDVRENAVAAAFRDPRFQPLAVEELDEVRIEVSVLSPPERLEVGGEQELLNRLRPGRDGLILAHHHQRATFLPAVWKTLPDPAVFLRELKRKAGLPADFWADDLKAWRYTTTSWSEKP